MKIVDQEYRLTPVSELQKFPGNPRLGDVELIADSIDENGFYGTCYVQKSTGRILAGWHRYLAALSQHADVVPTMILDVDDETAAKIVAVDNRTSDKAGYDEAALLDFLKTLTGLDGTGYTQQDLTDIEKLLAVPMSADEASDHHGTVDDSLFFPEIRMKVSPDTFDRWRDILEVHDGDNDVERFVKLLAEIEQLRG